MDSCVFKFNVLNEQTGKEEPCALMEQLTAYFKAEGHSNSHLLAKTFYGIATNEKFLRMAEDMGKNLTYNQQGQLNIDSLFDAIGKGEKVNKQIMKGILLDSIEGRIPTDHSTAIYKILSYNENNANSSFMVSFDFTADTGKVQLKIVDNTIDNKATLERNIKKMGYIETMMYYIRKLGIDAELKEGENTSIFDASRIETNTEGLLLLISLANGDKITIRQDLLEISGHLIMSLLGDSHSLVLRLLKALDKDITLKDKDKGSRTLKVWELYVEKLKNVGDDIMAYRQQLNTDNLHIVAGHLLGLYLNKEYSKQADALSSSKTKKIFNAIGNWGVVRLVGRMWNWIKTRFNKVNTKRYKKALKAVEEASHDMVTSFISADFKSEIEKADNESTNDEYYSISSTNVTSMRSSYGRMTKSILDQCSLLVDRIEKYDRRLAKDLRRGFSEAETAVDLNELLKADRFETVLEALEKDVLHAQQQSLRAIAHALQTLISNHDHVYELIKLVDPLNTADFSSNMVRYGNSISLASEYVRTSVQIINTIEQYFNDKSSGVKISDKIEMPNMEFGGTISLSILDLMKQFKPYILGDNKLENTVATLQRHYTLKMMEETVGSKIIHIGAMRTRLKDENGKFIVRTIKAKDLSMQDILDNLDDDISYYNRWLVSMTDNPDLMGQIFDKALKSAKFIANRNAIRERNNLLLFDDKWGTKDDVDFDHLYSREKDDAVKGVPTGYFVGYVEDPETGDTYGVDVAKWQKAYADFKDSLKKAFIKRYKKEALKKMRKSRKAYLYGQFINKKIAEWHKENTITVKYKDDNGKVFYKEAMPNPKKFKSDEYSNLTKNELKALKEYIKWKVGIDSKCLGNGASHVFRAPLILGTFTNTIQNLKDTGRNLPRRFFTTMKNTIQDAMIKNANDIDFGSDLTVNSNDPYYTYKAYEDDKINRLPLYYIRMLDSSRKHKLSTDIVGASIAYAYMATLYSQLKAIQHGIEIMKEQSKLRQVKINGEYKKDMGQSKSYQSIESFTDKELYGINYSTKNTPVWLHKLALNWTAFTSRLFLGGNLFGGMANTIMGMTEVAKESIVGQFWNTKDFGRAVSVYTKNNGSMFIDMFHRHKENFINQLAERFDLFGDNNRVFREFHDRRKNIFGGKTNLEVLKNYDPLIHQAYAPYSMGDHAMQIIPFLAIMMHTKLYYKDNEGNVKTTSVFDIYEKRKQGDNKDEQDFSKKGGVEVKTDYVYVKNIDLAEEVHKLQKDYDDLIELEKAVKKFIEDSSEDKMNFTVFDYNKYKDIIKKYNIQIDTTTSPFQFKLQLMDISNKIKKVSTDIHDMRWETEDEIALKNKARNICNRLHGIYNIQDKVAFQRSVLGVMLTSMKGYALGMVERRFGKSKYSLALESMIEGSVLTVFTTMLDWWTGGITFGNLLSMLFLPTFRSQYVLNMMENLGYNSVQYYNMKRNFVDFFMIMSTSILVGGIFQFLFGWRGALARDDDDKEKRPLLGTLYYFLSRLNQEQTAFNDPLAFATNEKGSLLNLFSAQTGSFATIWDIIKCAVNGEVYSKRSDYAGQSKAKIKLFKILPWIKVPYSKTYIDPDAAAEYFSYMRNALSGVH